MIGNYLKIALRSLLRNPGLSILTIGGLAIGIACSIGIGLYVLDERSYDRFHADADRIFRVLDFRKVDGVGEESSSAPTPLAEAMLLDYPGQIEAAVRFFDFQAPTLSMAYDAPEGERLQFNEPGVFFTDPEVFEVFTFPLASGDPRTALRAPHTVVVTQETAARYFGAADPVGKTLQFEGRHDLLVTGVLEPIPVTTHLKFDFLVSFATLDDPAVLDPGLRHHWIWNPSWTYLLLSEDTAPAELEAQFPGFVRRHFPASRVDRVKLYLQPLVDIHLHSKLDYEMGPNSDVSYLYAFSAIAVFILLISSINFMNLSTARSARREREIGVRKAVGGHRSQLIQQFLSESLLISTVATLVALPLVRLLLPLLNRFSGKSLDMAPLAGPEVLLVLLVLTVAVGLVSGVYPALFLSGFRPTITLRGIASSIGARGALLRKGLVVGQFTLSIIMIIGTLVAGRQIDYLLGRDLGFAPEEVILIPSLRSPVFNDFQGFKASLLQHPQVRALTTVEDIPGMNHQTGGYQPEGSTEEFQFPRLIVHDDFASALGIEMAAGREFRSEFATDDDDAVIINEAMVRRLGWESPASAIGRTLDGDAIVGVVRDFNFVSLHRGIGPFVLERVSDDARSLGFSARYIATRIGTENVPATLAFIRERWEAHVSEWPFEYLFLDQTLNSQYAGETTLARVSRAFTLLSLLVACLGLFGLASFVTESRTKEIGIRKVMGASVGSVTTDLTSSFGILVVIAAVLACPVAYLLLDTWLDGFAYRTAIGALPFITASVLAIAIAYLTVGYQAVKTALRSPVESLRYE